METLKPIYKKVMIVDDTEVDRFIATRNIKKHGFAEEVIAKESAKAALEYLNQCHDNPDNLPQLIFLDIRMPEMDGFDFLAHYERLPESVKKNCIIMMLSTSLNPDDHARAEQNQYVNQFVNKPLDKEKINTLINPSAITHAGTKAA
jgi:CheY-like chemotaxis protein